MGSLSLLVFAHYLADLIFNYRHDDFFILNIPQYIDSIRSTLLWDGFVVEFSRAFSGLDYICSYKLRNLQRSSLLFIDK